MLKSKKLITDLDSSKAPGFDCIPVVALKNWTWTCIHISWCLREFCFLDCWKSHLWSRNLRMLGRGLLLRTNALLVFFLSIVKSLKNLIISLFITSRYVAFWFPIWFQVFSFNCKSSDSYIWWNSRAFNRSGAVRAVALVI